MDGPEITAAEQEIAERYLRERSNAAVLSGFRYAAWFGFLAAPALGLMALLGAKGMVMPMATAFSGGAVCIGAFQLAKRGALVGWRMHAVMLVLISFPTAVFLIAEIIYPFGAASFITGPFSYLYFALLLLSGFFFDPWLTLGAGLTAGVEYFGAFLLAAPRLMALQGLDPLLYQDLTAPSLWAFKSAEMALAGLVIGALAKTARELLYQALHEEREKQGISRLFGQFVSPEVKDKILRERSRLKGERKNVVVLFSDIRGFTTYSEGADPERLVAHLNEYFDAMVDCITRHGGTVDKFIGDAVMAVFGGVLDLPDPAGAAVDAAKEMRSRLAGLNAEWRRASLPPLDNGIGLHFGEVLQGTIGSEDRKEFTVIGDAVNTASRLESATKEQKQPILVSKALVDALPEARRAECRPLGEIQLKGKAQRVEIFSVAA